MEDTCNVALASWCENMQCQHDGKLATTKAQIRNIVIQVEHSSLFLPGPSIGCHQCPSCTKVPKDPTALNFWVPVVYNANFSKIWRDWTLLAAGIIGTTATN